jgi:hypothetical protein
MYDCITKLCRTEAEVILNHVNPNAQGEAMHRKYKRLKLGGGQAYERSADLSRCTSLHCQETSVCLV